MKYSGIPLTIILACTSPTQAVLHGRSFFSPRPQGFGSLSTLHELEFIHDECIPYGGCIEDDCAWCGTFSVRSEYQSLFQANQQAEYFFGHDVLVFSGSKIPGRDPFNDVLADYFGLPTDFRSMVFIKPTIKTALFDVKFTSYSFLWGKRWFVQIDAPVVWTKWDFGLHECCVTPGELNYPAGYMGTELIERSDMPCNVTQAFRGAISFGDFEPMRYGRICGDQKETALADINMVLGVCLIDAGDHFFAMHTRVVAPTGTRPDGVLLYQPIIGNGYHWELGFGLSGYAKLWENDEGRHRFHLYGDGTVSHLFKALQKRSYDFKLNGVGSRYVLIEDIGTPIVQGLEVGGVAATFQYHGRVMPAINKTTLDTEIRVAAQADLTLKIAYEYNDSCGAELGYTLWVRTEEKIVCRERFPCNKFAIKGDAQVYGFELTAEDVFVGLNATQHAATISAAQGSGSATDDFTNANADTAAVATFQGIPLIQSNAAGSVNSGIGLLSAVDGSSGPVLLTDFDIDNCSALAPTALSNTIFFSMYHLWRVNERIRPYLEVGASAEFDGTGKKKRSAQSLWGVWLEGGFSY